MEPVNLVGIEQSTRAAADLMVTGPLLAVVVTGLVMVVLVTALAAFLNRVH